MVKLQEAGGQYFITIPKEYVANKGWVKGQYLVLGFNEHGDIIIKEVKEK